MTEVQVAVLLADLALIVLLAKMLGRLAQACGQPAVIGEIAGGILVGPTLFGGNLANTLFPADVRPYLGSLANLGLVLFMFLVGLELDFRRLRAVRRVVGAVAIGATAVPFGLGLLLAPTCWTRASR